MKNLGLNRKESFVFVLVSFMLVFTMNSFATGFELMESRSVSMVTPSSFDFLVNYEVHEYVEEELVVEEWMLTPEVFYNEMSEQDLTLENWMFDVEAFVGVQEVELNIEGWMTDVYAFLPQEENELVIENWMTDVNSFFNVVEKELTLESWMMDVNSFLEHSSSTLALK